MKVQFIQRYFKKQFEGLPSSVNGDHQTKKRAIGTNYWKALLTLCKEFIKILHPLRNTSTQLIQFKQAKLPQTKTLILFLQSYFWPFLHHLTLILSYLFSISEKDMGVCASRAINGSEYYVSKRGSFLICERSPKASEKVFEIHFNFECCLSTGNSTIQSFKERPQSRTYQIPIKLYKLQIDTSLSEICQEIECAFEMAGKMNCSKVQFIQPSFETEKNVTIIFGEIIRMLLYFDQKGMFGKQSKIYLNWSSVDRRSSIDQMRRSLTI